MSVGQWGSAGPCLRARKGGEVVCAQQYITTCCVVCLFFTLRPGSYF